MSGILLEPQDLRTLADRGVRCDDALSVAKLPRLVEMLDGDPLGGDSVRCRLDVGRDAAGRIAIRGRLKTQLRVSCQRCLEVMVVAIDEPFEWLFDREAAQGGADFAEPDTPLVLATLIEDEVLLAMPSYPMHGEREPCGSVSATTVAVADVAPASDKRTPFAGLRDLLRGDDD